MCLLDYCVGISSSKRVLHIQCSPFRYSYEKRNIAILLGRWGADCGEIFFGGGGGCCVEGSDYNAYQNFVEKQTQLHQINREKNVRAAQFSCKNGGGVKSCCNSIVYRLQYTVYKCLACVNIHIKFHLTMLWFWFFCFAFGV